MSQLNHRGEMLPQNTGLDDAAFPHGIAQPLSQAEIEDLLYTSARPVAERLERLREFRDELLARESADLGDDDPEALLAEVDDAIARIARSTGEAMDPASIDQNPEDHRETLSPDSDERAAIEAADEASVADDIGDQWGPAGRERPRP